MPRFFDEPLYRIVWIDRRDGIYRSVPCDTGAVATAMFSFYAEDSNYARLIDPWGAVITEHGDEASALLIAAATGGGE